MKNGYDLLHFDTSAMEERHNWAAVFSYDRLPWIRDRPKFIYVFSS